jgi:hypothetical protein
VLQPNQSSASDDPTALALSRLDQLAAAPENELLKAIGNTPGLRLGVVRTSKFLVAHDEIARRASDLPPTAARVFLSKVLLNAVPERETISAHGALYFSQLSRAVEREGRYSDLGRTAVEASTGSLDRDLRTYHERLSAGLDASTIRLLDLRRDLAVGLVRASTLRDLRLKTSYIVEHRIIDEARRLRSRDRSLEAATCGGDDHPEERLDPVVLKAAADHRGPLVHLLGVEAFHSAVSAAADGAGIEASMAVLDTEYAAVRAAVAHPEDAPARTVPKLMGVRLLLEPHPPRTVGGVPLSRTSGEVAQQLRQAEVANIADSTPDKWWQLVVGAHPHLHRHLCRRNGRACVGVRLTHLARRYDDARV